MPLWIVVEDISGDEPRYDALPWSPYNASIVSACSNIRAQWRIADETKEGAVAAVVERMQPFQANAVNETAWTESKIDHEIQMTIDALQKNNWNQAAAARKLGVHRKTVHRICKLYKIKPPSGEFRPGGRLDCPKKETITEQM